MHKRFLRWVLEVEGRTPEYLVSEEVQKEKLRNRTRRRACGFEEKLLEGRGRPRVCWHRDAYGRWGTI